MKSRDQSGFRRIIGRAAGISKFRRLVLGGTLLFVISLFCLGWGTAGQAQGQSPKARLGEARTLMYQLQGLEEEGAVQALAGSSYPLLVIERGQSISGSQSRRSADIGYQSASLSADRNSAGRLLKGKSGPDLKTHRNQAARSSPRPTGRLPDKRPRPDLRSPHSGVDRKPPGSGLWLK